jgi:hypothetical protein
LDTSSNIKWTEYECDPTGEDFEHYGNEWDWLEFFWNLYTTGGTGVKFEVSEINDVWINTVTKDAFGNVLNDQVAYFCCSLDGNGDPSSCVERDKSAGCGHSPNPPGLTTVFKVGKLWEHDDDFGVTKGLLDTVESKYGYGTAKYNLFANTGGYARVNY